MKQLSYESRALLIQDAQNLVGVLQQAVKQFEDRINAAGLTETQVIVWIIKEGIERVYHLLSVNHDASDYRIAQYRNEIANELDLDQLFGRFVQVPPLYGDNCFIDVEVRGFDLYMWYFKPETEWFQHGQWASNYSYQRKWN